MSWLAWLGLAVIVSAVAAVLSIQPKGTRPIEHSSMMGAARLALVVFVIICLYVAFRARAGG